MVIAQLTEKLHRQIDILAGERQAVDAAAEIVVAALKSKHMVWLAEIGHMLQHDFLGRAGGLAALRGFSWSFSVNAPTPEALANRPAEQPIDQSQRAARLAVEAGAMRAGDVLILGSVSGKNVVPVELAQAARDKGLKVIAFTCMEYTSQVESLHPSGKRLFECADVVMDLHTPYGDAAVEIPGYDHQVVPFSGISTLTIGWMLWARVMELTGGDAEPPVTFMSVNRAGGREAYEEAVKRWNQRGY